MLGTLVKPSDNLWLATCEKSEFSRPFVTVAKFVSVCEASKFARIHDSRLSPSLTKSELIAGDPISTWNGKSRRTHQHSRLDSNQRIQKFIVSLLNFKFIL